MPFRVLNKGPFGDIPRDLIILALINGLSGMALNGAAIFGMLAILSGGVFLHGIPGLAGYILINAIVTSIGYIGTARYAALWQWKLHTVLYAVFIVHAIGFIGAAFIHPICVAVSSGIGLGMFFSVFMLKNINDIKDKSRDAYATINGFIQRITSLVAPALGAGTLYAGKFFGFHDPIFPTFLSFGFCVLVALPLIHRMPNAALPCSISLPLKSVLERRHLPAMALFFTTIVCERLMYPLLMISSFILFSQVIETGLFTSFITALAIVSLALTHFLRLPGKRWIIIGISLCGLGIGFMIFDLSLTFISLLLAGALYAILQVNYFATWNALSARIIESEWGHLGNNQALIVAEVCVTAARIAVAVLLLGGGLANFSLSQNLYGMTCLYIVSAIMATLLARKLDTKYSLQGNA